MRTAKLMFEMFFWMLAAGVLLCGFGVAVGVLVAPVLGYVAALAMLGALPLIVRMVRTVRRRRAVAVISYLEQAVRLNLSLSRMLYAAQRSERGALVVRFAHFRQLLDDGYSIGAALAAGVPEIGEREASLIEAGERLGRLPQTLHKLVAEQSADAARQHMNELVFYRTYPFVMTVLMTSILGMVAVFVMPKFEQIFRDFAIQLPQITVTTMSAARVFGPIALAAVAATVLIFTGTTLWQAFHPARISSPIGSGIRDNIIWITPIAHGIAHDRGLADAFDLIAGALQNGSPLERALDEAAQIEINTVLRERFLRWQQNMLGGMSIADAARAASMPGLVVSMLANVGRGGGDTTAEVFQFLARYYQTRYSRTAALAYGAAVPIIVFFFAALVLCISLALMMPLMSLIDHLSRAMEVH
ncbi:MAG: type pilus assembly protein PilC [Phycisphaerales bacterium]|jgi:type IV pilus assembly protein PilC|nr:type pilus assembly protein PilC [Phycisphaerales bacterium]